MAQSNQRFIDDGDLFPATSFNLVGGGTVTVPDRGRPRPVLLTVYRGHWCSVCRENLRDIQGILGELQSSGALVLAASTETEEEARETIATLELTMPVAWGLDAVAFTAAHGGFYHAGEKYLHAANFAIKPDGRVVAAAYSTGPRGRFNPADWRKNLSKTLA